jgi:single-strand DNA-binding protein
MNKAMLMGRLGRDPELKTTQAGGAVVSFSMATNEREKQGDQWVDATEWHYVVAFGRTAELIAERCRKGDPVLVDGKMKTRKWTGKDGVEKQRTEVLASTVQFLARLGAGEAGAGPTEPQGSGTRGRGHYDADGGTPF